MTTMRAMPHEYRKFLLAVGLFGIADFAPTLMILRATQVLTPSIGAAKRIALCGPALLFRNVVYAVAYIPSAPGATGSTGRVIWLSDTA